MRYRWKGIFLAAAAACLLTGCQGAQDGEPVHNPVPEQQEQTKHPEAEEALGRALQAVESQFPDRRFEPLPEEETVLNSMTAAVTTKGLDGTVYYSLAEFLQ